MTAPPLTPDAAEVARCETHVIDGIAYVLPRYEGRPRWVKRIGPFGIGISWRWSSFNIGIDILKAGGLIAIGPMYFWLAHIEKQSAFYRAADAEHQPKGSPDENLHQDRPRR